MYFRVRDAISLTEKRARSAELTIPGELLHNGDVRGKSAWEGEDRGDDWDVDPESLCRKSGSGYGADWWKMPEIVKI